MLKDRNNVRKIRVLLMALISIIMILGFYINAIAIESGNGTINPIYKPEWAIETDEDGKQKVYIDTGNKTLSINIIGTAYKTQTLDTNAAINYDSPVTTTLTQDKILVYIDGQLDGDINGNGELDDGETPSITKSLTQPEIKEDIEAAIHTLTLSGFEETIRQTGKEFKEWSGNISIKILGRGEETTTYDANVLTDDYGNQSMMEIDSTGTWINILLDNEDKEKITAIDSSVTDITTTTPVYMFTDFIKPEFTYEYTTTNPDINTGTETVTVVFDVTDKYFESTALANDSTGSLIEVIVDEDENANTPITKVLTKIKDVYWDVTTGMTYVEPNATGTGRKVGERYQLVITGLDQEDGFSYSGPMTLSFDAGAKDAEGNLISGIIDKSGNLSSATSITMGVNEPGGDADDEIVVDVVDPIWKVQNSSGQEGEIDLTTDADGNVSATMTLIGIDKYFKQSLLTADDIQIQVDGVEDITSTAPDLEKDLSDAQYIKLDENGNYVNTTADDESAIGVKYTFSITGFKETDNTFFTNRANANDNDDTTNGRLYREYSGDMTIIVPAGKLEDETGNTNNLFEVDLGHVDTLRPEVIKVSSQSNINTTNVELSTHTIVFDIVDKYMSSSSITTTDTSMIHVYLDGEEAASITKPATEAEQTANEDKIFKEIKSIETLRDDVNSDGTVDTSEVIGYRYTLELSGFENPRTSINYDRLYTDWSGSLSIKIDEDTVKDTSNIGNAETILYGDEAETTDKTKADHADYIKPDATYKYSEADVNTTDKTFKMVFEITDKFFGSEDANSNGTLDDGEDINGNGQLDTGVNLDVTDLEILMSAEEETGTDEDHYYDLMDIDIIRNNLSLQIEEIKNQVVVDVVDGTSVKEEKVIGKRYTLVVNHLEQVQKVENNYYLDYSGSITITVPEAIVTDTSGNGNNVISITSGIDIPGGEVVDIAEVDVVDPIWERTESTTDIHNNTAIMTLEGTDKYFYEVDDTTTTEDDGYGTLTLEEIKLFVDGTEATGNISEGVKTFVDTDGNLIGKVTLSEGTKLYEQRIVETEYSDGDVDTGYTTETVQYGIRYVVTITDVNITEKQVKIQLPEGTLVDQSGNKSNLTDFIIYNTLRTATDSEGEWEDEATSGFLGNATIARQDIEQIVFVSSVADAPTIGSTTADGNVTICWDVSATKDNSILAWTSQTSAPYTVYIGSDDDIYGNIDSSYLFSYIGYGSSATKTETISGISLLDTRNVTNMSYMFNYCGHKKMTALDLGANFDTKNVTDMNNMFNNCGYTAMTTFSLGSKFDTTKVTNMSSMFQGFAQNAASFTTLDLGATGVTFNTIAVTDMSNMFNGCGQKAMTTFSLGSSFSTGSVQNMSGMFQGFAYKLETLTLGSNFNTSAVTDMSNMFNACGQTAMKTLTLGNSFNTTAVQNMTGMFQDFAKSSTTITSLDLGDVFYTTSATDMTNMFYNCGYANMTILDLGPAFTKIADTYTDFIKNTGKSGCVIYAPESIYNDMTHFKTSTDSTTTIEYSQGTINPVYKPEWEKVSSTIDIDNKEITITFKGYANETFTNGTYTGSYLSDITSSVIEGNDAANLLVVKVDGEVAEEITQTVTQVSVTNREVQYTIKLSGFEQTTTGRQAGKNFLEWSGNIAVQPVKGTLIDIYGNKNMISIDDSNGNWLDIELRDAGQDGATGNWIDDDTETTEVEGQLEDNNTDANTNGTMFTDYIKPEFTYEYYNTTTDGDTNANTVIDYANNTVTVVFDVTDKYFKQAQITADDIEVKVDNDADANTAIRKELSKKTLDADETVGNITYKANGDIYYTVNGVSKKIGERYQLVITNLESSYGVGYSGIVTLSFDPGAVDEDGNLTDGIMDMSGNLSNAKTITIGIDEPANPDHSHTSGTVVDVVDPIWSYADSDIDRTNNEVNIYIIGSDKFYKENTLTKNNITVFVDNSSTTVDTDRDGVADANVTSITKTLTDITDEMQEEANATRLAELIAGAGLTDSMTTDNDLTDIGVIYKLTLSTFGTISGETKVVLPAETIEDTSGNKNTLTTIEVGNVTWVEDNEPLESTDDDYPRYDAFRENVVDFIKPVITYNSSTVMVDTDGDGEGDTSVTTNPDIDYTNKIVTVKFTVTDKYLLESDLIETTTDGEGNSIQIPKNITLIIDGTTIYTNDGDDTTTDTREVTTSITSTNIDNGIEYTLVVENLQKYEQLDNDGNTYSGPMQLVFEADVIDDTSGNKNLAKTISLDTNVESDVVDVVDPIIEIVDVNGKNYSGRNSANTITRTDGSEKITVRIRGIDKYLSSLGGILDSDDAVAALKVKVVTHDGTVIEDASSVESISTAFGISTEEAQQFVITKSVQRNNKLTTYIDYTITLSGFLTKEITTSEGDKLVVTSEGLTSVIIPEDVITDTSGNGNIETEVYVGKATDTTAYGNSIIDFTDPTWNYATSSITRDRDNETGTVTIKILGHDNYYSNDTLTKEVINVYINGTKNTDIVKDLVEITDTTELTTLATQAGLTEEVGTRTITDVLVGYTLTLSNFGTNERITKIELPGSTIVDTSGNGNQLTEILVGNPEWVETDEPLESTDANYPKWEAFRNSIVDFIKPVITQGDVTLDRNTDKVYIKFTATDTNFLESNIGTEDITIDIDGMRVYGTGSDTTTDSTAELELTNNNVTDANGSFIGYEYTITLSALELSDLIGTDIFLRHSGDIIVTIADGQVEDTSGNKNIETELTTFADFVDPIIYYHSKYTNWEDRYALITVRATDRFYDLDASNLQPSDLTLYKQNEAGEWINITNQFYDPDNGVEKLTITSVSNGYGEDFIIRLDDFEEEFVMRIDINSQVIYDTSDNYNKAHNADYRPIIIALDNRRPSWKYVSIDTDITDFEDETTTGTISFYVDGVDKYLDVTNSSLEKSDIKILLDEDDITNLDNITVTHLSTDSNYTVDGENGELEDADGMRSMSYRIDVTGLTQVGTYTLVIAEETLIDDFDNTSPATTISCSRSAISSNTTNHTMVTYHVSPDEEQVHHSYIRELMSVNITGTNSENTTYRPSTLGELHNNGENPLFAEPMYNVVVNGYNVSSVYAPKSFAGWAEADEDGNIVDGGTTYGLYDEIPETVTNLKAVWQDATIVFVSNSAGDNSNNGQLPESPVKDIETAYSKLSASGTAENNIIIIMDAVEWNSTTTLSKNATITSLYAGVDYRVTANAELKISSNMQTNADIIFDNIELYANSTTVSDGTDYLANGTYTNMLIANYANITLGRRVTTPDDKYTFGAIVGGNYATESTTGTIGTNTIIVEAGRYNNIIAGSAFATATTTAKTVTHEVVIGNMKDAAISRNDKLTITGYLSMGELTGATNSYDQIYSDVTLYSGTFTGDKVFNKSSEDVAIYLRSLYGEVNGKSQIEMFGGEVNANIYAGSRKATTYSSTIVNTMKFYGGKVVGNIFGQGVNDTFTGTSDITLSGIINITGNVFGGSNVTTSGLGNGTGNTNITINSTSATVNGNIYGGSNGIDNSGYLTGITNITVNAGTLTNIYGSGKNAGNSGNTNIIISNGTVSGNIVGGAYNAQTLGTANITVYGGIIGGNIFGGNENTTSEQLESDTNFQNATIIIGTTDETITTIPTINGIIYGGGVFDKVGDSEIQLIEAENTISAVYGGSNQNAVTSEVNIILSGATVNSIYGGGQGTGTVGLADIDLLSGTATDVYGGGYGADVTESNITLQGTATVTSIYGGSNASATITGTVTTSNVTLTSGNVTNVFGGGNSSDVGRANVTLNGITIDTIHGGSKDAGTTTTTNVVLTSGTVNTVFGGGLDSTVGTSNVKHQGTAVVKTIYGGNNSGTGDGGSVGTSNITVTNTEVENIYGGNYLKGTTTTTNINIQGTAKVTGKLYGGGYKSNIATESETGSATINITGGTIENDLNGGSEQGVVYGTTNINISGDTEIKGNIYGGGSSELAPNRDLAKSITNYNYDFVSVVGTTHIKIDNTIDTPLTFDGSIYGAGNGSTYSGSTSTIHVNNLGTSTSSHTITSIERTDRLFIGNSFIELLGKQDINNKYQKTSYTLNKITNGLTVHSGTTLYTRRGFNMVGGFNSFVSISEVTGNGTKASVTITDGAVETRNVDNRLYTFEGINLIFSKEEGPDTATSTNWGEVNGMTFFGMYALDSSSNKVFDIYNPDTYNSSYTGTLVEDFFANGTYVEGLHESGHTISIDGFYTVAADYETNNVEVEVIQPTPASASYYDWLIGADRVNYNISLIGSIFGEQSMADLLLDYNYAPNATYTLDRVSLNALNLGVNLVNPIDIGMTSENANNTFGLTIETDTSGWLNKAQTSVYTTDDNTTYNNGSFVGDTTYNSDNSSTAGIIKFKLYNSLNITETKDLGNVNLILTGKTTTGEDASQGNTFIIVIAVNIQTEAVEQIEDYVPSFTDSVETELHFTTDSEVDLTYLLFKDMASSPYENGDYYRVISTSTQLPTGTKLTLKDYGQGNSPVAYYYHVTDDTEFETETVDGVTRYLYKLSNFFEMDSTTAKYEDSDIYYHSEGFVLEKYDLSIDFMDSGLDAHVLAQETYLELRNSTTGEIKYDNNDKTIKYNLHYNKNAVLTGTISNNGNLYSVIETTNVPFTLTIALTEQETDDGERIMDTKYYDKIGGIAIEVVDGVDGSGDRITTPAVQNVKIVDASDSSQYTADESGVIRIPLLGSVSSLTKQYTFSITQNSVEPGYGAVNVDFFTSDDGKYFGSENSYKQSFDLLFVSKELGVVSVEATEDSRIISSGTGENLEGNTGIDMTVSIGETVEQTNIRIELYKRNSTYDEDGNYTGTSYTLVNISDYLEGTWDTEEPEDYGLTPGSDYEYMFWVPETEATAEEATSEAIEIPFERALNEGVATGEYKLVFKSYHENTLVQTARKTFIVTE